MFISLTSGPYKNDNIKTPATTETKMAEENKEEPEKMFDDDDDNDDSLLMHHQGEKCLLKK